MTLTLNDRAWVLAERLYLHARGVPAFKALLQEFGLEYSGEPYKNFDTNRVPYTFMSEPNYAFAEFMKLVPAYKYLPLLQRIIFDREVRKTQRDRPGFEPRRRRTEMERYLGVNVHGESCTFSVLRVEWAD